MNRRITYKIRRFEENRWDGLALNCHIWKERDGSVNFRFFDTIRGHSIPGHIVKDGEDAFTFFSQCSAIPGEWQFEKLTIEDVRRGLVWIEDGETLGRVIHSTDDLQEWYRKRFGEEAGLYYPEVLYE